ncbi:hypothetical protein FB451DRAFT_1164073 [Mycena latifolia]|nr:hypothetical protein FB451DRAFT_1164073 [Mycena latifolia]
MAAETGKKSISVKILVSEQYLVSLRAKLGIKSGAAKGKAIGTHNVTLKTLPNNDLFGMFFKNSKRTLAPDSTLTEPQPTFSGMALYMAMNGMYGFYPPWGMPSGPPGSHLNPPMPGTPTPVPSDSHAAGSKLSATFQSSDPPDMGTLNPYPEIAEFLEQLDSYQSNCCLLECIPKFEELNFYNINEIAKLGTSQQIAHDASISLRNATYILEQVKADEAY